MEIDALSPKMMSISSFHIQLWRNSVFLVSTAIRCNAERCSDASVFIIQLYNFSCDCLCAFDYLMCTAVILIVILQLSFACTFITFTSVVHRRQCLQSPQKFCYICGSYVFDSKVRKIDSFVKKLYFSYFQLKVGDQDKCFAPHIACNTCVDGLRCWYDGKRKAMPFVIPTQ